MNQPRMSAMLVCGLLVAVMITSLSSGATNCTATAVSKNAEVGESISTSVITCTNNNANNSVSVYNTGVFYQVSPSPPITIPPQSSSNIQLIFPTQSAKGFFEGLLYFSDGSATIPIKLNITQSVSPSSCQINPSLVTYTQAIQQGTELVLPKITFEPVNCPSQLILTPSSVSIQGGIVTTQGQKPLALSSVTSDGVQVKIDTNGLTTSQTYFTSLNINAFSKQFQIPFTITVTSGTSPVTNITPDNIPTCSISNNILNLNVTYTLVCSNLQPDIKIIPEADASYIKGIGVEKSINQYIWKFTPIKLGNTIIKAKFDFQDAPIGIPFTQEAKIQSSSLQTPGTSINIIFYPELKMVFLVHKSVWQMDVSAADHAKYEHAVCPFF